MFTPRNDTHELCLYSSISFLQRQFAVFSIPLSKITAVTPIHAKPSLQQLDNTPYGLLMHVEEKDIDLYFDSMYKFDEVFEVVSSFVWKGKLVVELKETPSDSLLAFYWQRIEEYTAKMQGHYKEIAVCNLKALVESKIYDSHFGILPENLELALSYIQQLNEDKLQYAGKENEYEGIGCKTLPAIETDLKFSRKETFPRIIELINKCKERILPYFVASQLVDIFESNELDYNEKSKELKNLLIFIPNSSLQIFIVILIFINRYNLTYESDELLDLSDAIFKPNPNEHNNVSYAKSLQYFAQIYD